MSASQSQADLSWIAFSSVAFIGLLVLIVRCVYIGREKVKLKLKTNVAVVPEVPYGVIRGENDPEGGHGSPL